MAKKQTQSQKAVSGSKKDKNSKYGKKLLKRVKDARDEGLPVGTPYPVINAPSFIS